MAKMNQIQIPLLTTAEDYASIELANPIGIVAIPDEMDWEGSEEDDLFAELEDGADDPIGYLS